MVINDLVHDTESMQYFPRPSVPDSIYERIPSFTMQDDTRLEEENAQNEVDGHIIGAFMECLEEIDIKGKELFKKIVSNGHVEIPLGRLAREAIGDSRAKDFLGKMVTKVSNKMKAQKDEDFVVAKRDVSIDDELSQKLERFKVKTVNIGGVVKEDHK
ncbi:hypothetical protein L1987_86828 [Smallanthus sonchifolius]|uniref:Uncharacterized protein n=1 Tax=Smallanthus sonchifolius TaxID=185202 RepID=A0ACB8Y0D9_9ASTR|nr:hypothetical protein L1987_86828 [Smallanthus sonchifolius]